jgi:hypothetical protein
MLILLAHIHQSPCDELKTIEFGDLWHFELNEFLREVRELNQFLIAPMVKPINRWFLHLNFNNSNGFGTVPKVTMQRLQVKLHMVFKDHSSITM